MPSAQHMNTSHTFLYVCKAGMRWEYLTLGLHCSELKVLTFGVNEHTTPQGPLEDFNLL